MTLELHVTDDASHPAGEVIAVHDDYAKPVKLTGDNAVFTKQIRREAGCRLDTDERRRFAQVSHEYLIQQLQFTGDESVTFNIKQDPL